MSSERLGNSAHDGTRFIHISRRSFLNRAAVLGLTLPSILALLSACAERDDDVDDAAAVTADEQDDSLDEELDDEEEPTDDAPDESLTTELRYGVAGEYNDFNPWILLATNNNMYNSVFSRLLYKDFEGVETPDIATSWTIADDALSMTLDLRDDVYWHDGEQCTANDFVTMYGYTQDEELGQTASVEKMTNLLAPIASVEALDDFTVELQFEQQTPYIIDIFDYWYAIRIEDPDDPGMMRELPVGTGPFVAVEWRPAEFLRLQAFEQYHGDGGPNVDELRIQRFESAETLVPNLRAEGVHGVQVTELSELAPLEDDPDHWLESHDVHGSVYNIIVNVAKPPFDQKEARQALSYSLNRRAMIDAAFFGVGQPITSPFYHQASLGYDEALVMAHEFDLDRSESLFREAGVDDLSEIELNIHVTGLWPPMELYSLMWQQDLAQIGITLNVHSVESALFYEIAGDEFLDDNEIHPWLTGRTTRDPAVFWGTQWNYRGGETNRYPYRNEELESLVAEGAIEPDEDRRIEIYQRLNEIVVDECHMIQIATNPSNFAFSNKVEGVEWDFIGMINFSRARVTD